MAKLRSRVLWGVAGTVVLAILTTFAVGDYFASEAEGLVPATSGRAPSAHRLSAVVWSGDMGFRVGVGSGIVHGLAESGVPVITMSSPVEFRFARDGDFARQAVARSLEAALNRTGADGVALVGYSFGADVLAATIGALPPRLKRKIASVVLAGPGTEVYFQANPLGIAYLGTPDSEPARTVPGLRALRVTCIYGRAEADSLCLDPVMKPARRMAIPGGHLFIGHRADLDEAVVEAVLHPAGPMA